MENPVVWCANVPEKLTVSTLGVKDDGGKMLSETSVLIHTTSHPRIKQILILICIL
jgi:hypothetical protein